VYARRIRWVFKTIDKPVNCKGLEVINIVISQPAIGHKCQIVKIHPAVFEEIAGQIIWTYFQAKRVIQASLDGCKTRIGLRNNALTVVRNA
jgi:hypothetical protein